MVYDGNIDIGSDKMKKISKSFIICLTAIIIVFGIGFTLYKNSSFYFSSNNNLSSKKDTGNSADSMRNEENTQDGKSFSFGKYTGKWSLMEVTSDKDTKITIDDNTKINKGKFYMVVLDSDYNIVAKKNELYENNNKSISFTIPKDEKYIIRIVGKKASGSFNMKISANSNIKINHKDFFE